MLQPKARWKVEEIEEAQVQQLISALNIPKLIAELLIIRGITEPDAAERFLEPNEDHFHDPFLLQGMHESVSRIQQALRANEKIRIYGDFDADGVSSTAIMIHLLRQLGAHFDFYIPNRATEGYGLNLEAIDQAHRDGITLLITVDNGISAVEQIAYAKQLGIQVIITDHHEPPEQLPEAYAMINPKLPTCPYPFKELAGVGVALKLAQALLGKIPAEWFELAAIGTVADLMPLIDENRLIVKLGLQEMQQTSQVGIQALLAISGIVDKEVTASHIGFSLAPRINASGRMDQADSAVKLLVSTDNHEADALALELDRLNKERQAVVEKITNEVLKLTEITKWHEDEVMIAVGEDWNVGVIGIVASRLLDKYYRPVIVLSVDTATGLAKGSARSIPGFDIYGALTSCSSLLEHFGGHQSAAGMTLQKDAIPALREQLCLIAKEALTEADYIPLLQADLVCDVQDVQLELIEQLEQLAPFGMGNLAPRFVFSRLNLHELRTMGKDHRHMKLIIGSHEVDGSSKLEAVGFGKGNLAPYITPTANIELLGELGINEWNGLRRPQIIIQDLCVLEPQVYDWRGSHVKRWNDWLASCEEQPDRNAGVLLHRETDMQRLPEGLEASRISLWLADDGQLLPKNAAAQQMKWSDVQDVLLVTMPPQLDSLSICLQQAIRLERIYAMLEAPSAMSTLPSREGFKQMYALMRQASTWRTSEAAWAAFSRRSGLSREAVQFIIEVFHELGFVECSDDQMTCVPTPEKQELTTSRRYQAELERQEAENVLLYSTSQELKEWIMKQLSLQESQPLWKLQRALEEVG